MKINNHWFCPLGYATIGLRYLLLSSCGAWIKQVNPNALEITGLQVSEDEGLYDPTDDGDPDTGATCSATTPLIIALASSAGLTLANFFNCTAIRRVNPYLVS